MICKALFFKSNHKKFEELFFASSEKKPFSTRVMARTVQLVRHDEYCPIKAESRAVDSQSDLRILLVMIRIKIVVIERL